MSNLESLKDPRTVASMAALFAVAASSSYFYSEISKIKEEQEAMKTHLAAIIPYASPENSQKLSSTIHEIHALDSKLNRLATDMQNISKHVAKDKPAKKVYKRLTKSTSSTEKTETGDLDEDIAAML